MTASTVKGLSASLQKAQDRRMLHIHDPLCYIFFVYQGIFSMNIFRGTNQPDVAFVFYTVLHMGAKCDSESSYMDMTQNLHRRRQPQQMANIQDGQSSILAHSKPFEMFGNEQCSLCSGAGTRKMSKSHNIATATEAFIGQIMASLYFTQRFFCHNSQCIRYEKEQSPR